MISVLLVDDHAVVRAGVRAILEQQADMRVVGEAADGAAAMAVYRATNPDVVLLDLKLPVMTGWQVCEALRREFPRCRILIFTTLVGDEDIHRALEAGAAGYVLKEANQEELTDAIRQVHAGFRSVPPEVGCRHDERLDYDELSERELDVVRLMASGMTNRQVAGELGLTEQTIKGYVKNIAFKLDVTDRTAASILALRRGLIQLEQVPGMQRRLDKGVRSS